MSDYSVELIDHMGNDQSVVNAARVSFANSGDEDRTVEQNEKLIGYLARNHHWTPFSHTSITLRLEAPIPIRTQLFKHKVGLTENEESRRYVSYTPKVFTPCWRKSVESKKQGSGELFGTITQKHCNGLYKDSVDKAIETYEHLLKLGVCEEQARFVLPQGVLVNWYWTGSLAAFARVYTQRIHPHAQEETREIASAIGAICKELYPVSWEALTS